MIYRKRSKAFQAVSFIATVAIFTAAVAGAWKLGSQNLMKDYSAMPSGMVFRDVFGQPVPDGVKDLTVSGHGLWHSQVVWMRMSANTSSISAITAATFPTQRSEYKYVMPDASMAMAANDAKAANWDKVPHLKNAEIYSFHNIANGKGWQGTVVVDRGHRMVYVSAHS